jgi:3-(3-hydroxy-phenyl)propionate hydroxylase
VIDVSVAMGRILSPTSKAVAGTRDKIAAALNLLPAAKKWIAEGRYKPKPRFHVGALVQAVGPAATGQPVGSMFPQPRVDTRTETNVLQDDVLGPWFSVLVWGNDPRHVFDTQSLDTLTRLGVKLISIRPTTQLHWDAAPTGDPRETAAEVTVIGDQTGRLKQWFDTHPVGFVIVRPDRYVAAAALAQHAPSVTASLATAIHLSSPQFTPGDHHDTRPRLDVAQPAAGALAAAG